MNWRNSKLFYYGWFPIRVVCFVAGTLATATLASASYLAWLSWNDFHDAWRRNF